MAKYLITTVDVGEGGTEVEFDEADTAVNLMTVGDRIKAVLSTRIFTPEERAEMERARAMEAAFMASLSAGGETPTFELDEYEDDDFEADE